MFFVHNFGCDLRGLMSFRARYTIYASPLPLRVDPFGHFWSSFRDVFGAFWLRIGMIGAFGDPPRTPIFDRFDPNLALFGQLLDDFI